MPYNGAGTFTSLGVPTFPAVTGDYILASYFNATMNDVFLGLSTALPRDGQVAMSANLPMGAFKITGLANGGNPQDATTFLQVFTSPTFSNATLTGVPVAPTAAYGTNTTQIATMAAIQAAVTLLPSGALPSVTGKNTAWSLTPNSGGTGVEWTVKSPIPTVAVFTASGTWTCPAGVTLAQVTVVGGGASSTCCSTRVGLGGSGGGTAIKTLTVTPGTVYTCTIGAGGTAPTGADTNANSGGTSSFSGSGISTVSATGGAVALYSELWTGAGMGSGGDINMPGGAVFTMPGTGANRCPAMGGSSSMGGPTRFSLDATGYGCGGGGSPENSSQGYAGKAGVIVIEY